MMPRVCSLFSGIGGIDLGFIQAGFDIVWANEYDAAACRTYRKNFGDAHLVEGDIRKVKAEDNTLLHFVTMKWQINIITPSR